MGAQKSKFKVFPVESQQTNEASYYVGNMKEIKVNGEKKMFVQEMANKHGLIIQFI